MSEEKLYCPNCKPGHRLKLGKIIDGIFIWEHGSDGLEFDGNGKITITCHRCGEKTVINLNQ